MFTQKQINAAVHTLWQAAIASGGIGTIAESAGNAHINLSGVEQGLSVAGMAVGASALSLAKSFTVNFLASHKASTAVRDAEKLAAIAKSVADYQSKHAVTAAPVAAVPAVGATLPTAEASA